MKAKAKTAVYYNGKRYEEGAEVNVAKEFFDETLFMALEQSKEIEEEQSEEATDKKGAK